MGCSPIVTESKHDVERCGVDKWGLPSLQFVTRLLMMSAMSRLRTFRALAALLLMLAVWVVYGWSGQLQPVWDDTFLVGSNPFFRSPYLIGEMFRQWLWVDPIAAYYRPVQNLSFLADYLLWGTWFPGYRATNLLWHGAAAILFWRLACGLLRDTGSGADKESEAVAGLPRPEVLAWVAALLWAVHPAHNAAVAYVSGRADPLAAVFALGGWLIFRSATQTRWGWGSALAFAGAFGCGLLALCARETGMVWLIVFALYEGLWRSGGSVRIRAPVWLGTLMLFCVYALLRTLPPVLLDKNTAPDSSVGLAIWKTILALGDYATLFFVPFRLSMERVLIPEGGGGGDLLPAALAMLGVLLALACAPGATRRLRVFCTVWFLAGFVPISPMLAPNADSAEHWMYLPFVGLALGGMAAWSDLPDKLRRSAGVIVVCWICFLGVRTHLRARDWKDHATFLRATLERGQPTARLLGLASAGLARAGNQDRAEALLRTAIEKFPKDRLLKIYLGTMLQARGDCAAALPLVQMTPVEMLGHRGVHPLYSIAPVSASACLIAGGRNSEGEAVLRAGNEIWPDNWRIVQELVRILEREHRQAEAAGIVAAFSEKHPWHLDAAMLRASFLARDKRIPEAEKLLRHARTLDVRSPTADRMLAGLHADAGDWLRATADQQRAIRRSAGEPRDWLTLAALLEKTGDPAGAETARQKASASPQP